MNMGLTCTTVLVQYNKFKIKVKKLNYQGKLGWKISGGKLTINSIQIYG